MGGDAVFAKANQLHLEGKFQEAEELYDQILSQNHDNSGLLATMGTMYLSMQKPGLAISMLHRALENKIMRSPEVYSNLGLAYKYTGQMEKAMRYMEKAAVDKDATPETISTYAAMFMESDDQDKGMELLAKAIKTKPDLAVAHWNLALMQLASGQWGTAWDEHDWGAGAKQRPDRAKPGTNIPLWDGTHGQTVWVWGEQGLGDEIMFASMLPELMKTNKVIFECHPRLKTLFDKSFGLDCYGTRDSKTITWPETEQIDARIAIGSLGKFYRRTAESFPGTPYLKADPLMAPGRKMRVGISWTGGMKAGRVRKRTVPLSWWRRILQQDCEFVSLQYTDADDEIDMVNASGFDIKKPAEAKSEDYYETARLVQSCDLVISCCTSVIHLAGALGVPCWVLTPKNPAWRYQNSGKMPWYRSVRLYRQMDKAFDSWVPVIDRIADDLQDAVLSFNKEEKAA